MNKGFNIITNWYHPLAEKLVTSLLEYTLTETHYCPFGTTYHVMFIQDENCKAVPVLVEKWKRCIKVYNAQEAKTLIRACIEVQKRRNTKERVSK